jgi:predicted transcriptional regulator
MWHNLLTMTLTEYLKTRKLSALRYSKLIGVPASSLTRYIQGKRGLSLYTVRAIVKNSNGMITLEDLSSAPPKRKNNNTTEVAEAQTVENDSSHRPLRDSGTGYPGVRPH